MGIILLFSLALSVDLFAFAAGYGLSKVRIPPLKCGIITAVCGGMLAAGLALREIVAPLVPPHALSTASFAVLAVIGAAKLTQKNDTGGIIKPLSVAETFIVGAAVSFDGFIGGIASGFIPSEYPVLFTVFLLMSAFAVAGGNRLGLDSSSKFCRYLGRTAGAALLMVAVSRLFM